MNANEHTCRLQSTREVELVANIYLLANNMNKCVHFKICKALIKCKYGYQKT